MSPEVIAIGSDYKVLASKLEGGIGLAAWMTKILCITRSLKLSEFIVTILYGVSVHMCRCARWSSCVKEPIEVRERKESHLFLHHGFQGLNSLLSGLCGKLSHLAQSPAFLCHRRLYQMEKITVINNWLKTWFTKIKVWMEERVFFWDILTNFTSISPYMHWCTYDVWCI